MSPEEAAAEEALRDFARTSCIHPNDARYHRRAAQAVLQTLGLTEEWAAGSAGGFGHAWDSEAKARRSLATILSNNARYRARTGRDPDWGEGPYIARRLVFPWVVVEHPQDRSGG